MRGGLAIGWEDGEQNELGPHPDHRGASLTVREAGRSRLLRRGFWLEYASMAWMTVEAGVAISAGVVASSIALVGFGLDSVIEFFAAVVVVWQLRCVSEEREARAVRLIGVSFFALAAFLAAEGISDLVSRA